MLLLVALDIRGLTGDGERNQTWMDGVIFLQQPLVSIQALGWASCTMNFSATNVWAKNLRKLARIVDYEEIICFVSIGEANLKIATARSKRKLSSQALRNESFS